MCFTYIGEQFPIISRHLPVAALNTVGVEMFEVMPILTQKTAGMTSQESIEMRNKTGPPRFSPADLLHNLDEVRLFL